MQISHHIIRSILSESIFRRSLLITSPRFCSWFPHFFKNLPQADTSIRYKRLHIILRANDAVMNLSASRQLESIGLKTKLDVLKKGVDSLATAAKNFRSKFGDKNIAVTIVNDNLSVPAKELIANFFAPLSVSFIPSEPGNGPTFRRQISIASDDAPNTLVAICEDDYLFNENTFTTVFELFNTTPRLERFTPHNHPNIVRLCLPTYIYKLSGRFYQYTSTTTCTFFVGADLIRKCRNLFLKYDGKEETSINKVWRKHICISPCCWTLAEHLHLSDLSPVQTLLKHAQ